MSLGLTGDSGGLDDAGALDAAAGATVAEQLDRARRRLTAGLGWGQQAQQHMQLRQQQFQQLQQAQGRTQQADEVMEASHDVVDAAALPSPDLGVGASARNSSTADSITVAVADNGDARQSNSSSRKSGRRSNGSASRPRPSLRVNAELPPVGDFPDPLTLESTASFGSFTTFSPPSRPLRATGDSFGEPAPSNGSRKEGDDSGTGRASAVSANGGSDGGNEAPARSSKAKSGAGRRRGRKRSLRITTDTSTLPIQPALKSRSRSISSRGPATLRQMSPGMLRALSPGSLATFGSAPRSGPTLLPTPTGSTHSAEANNFLAMSPMSIAGDEMTLLSELFSPSPLRSSDARVFTFNENETRP